MDERQKKEMSIISNEKIIFNYPMSRQTSFRVGGPAEGFFRAESLEDLRKMIFFLNSEKIPFMVAGKGSNLLVKDGGVEGVVITLEGSFAEIETTPKGENIRAGSGMTLKSLLDYCTRIGLTGLEFLAGIPGTVGGAVAMNAGAWGKEISEALREIQVLYSNGEIKTVLTPELEFKYRSVSLDPGSIITAAVFELNKDNRADVSNRIKEILKNRKQKHPLNYPSAGSVFKNPPGDFAGRLIEEQGLKGRRVGGAMISDRHANFIVNTGKANAEDIMSLIRLAQEAVKTGTGIELESEIKVVGF